MQLPRRSSPAQRMPLLTISIRPTNKVPRILLIRVCTLQRAPLAQIRKVPIGDMNNWRSLK